MNKLQTITRLLLKDNTSDYKKNLYKIPFTNIYFLKATNTANNLKFTMPDLNYYIGTNYSFNRIVDIPKTLEKKLRLNEKKNQDNSRILD